MGGGYIDRPLRPVKRETTNRTKKTKNSIFARPAAAATRLKKPNIPAITATTSRIADHFNITYHLSFFCICSHCINGDTDSETKGEQGVLTTLDRMFRPMVLGVTMQYTRLISRYL